MVYIVSAEKKGQTQLYMFQVKTKVSFTRFFI